MGLEHGICKASFFINEVGEIELECTLSGYYKCATFFQPEEYDEEIGEIIIVDEISYSQEEVEIISKFIIDEEEEIIQELKKNYKIHEDDNY